jgi:ABC-type amino acid transport substrate-binding protein
MKHILLGLLFGIHLSAATPTTPLIVGTESNYPPYEFKEGGELKGFEIDLVREVGKRLARPVQIKDMAFDNLLLEAVTGRIHVIAAAMTPTEERKKKILFSKSYIPKNPFVILSLPGASYKTMESLKGKKVAVNSGYTAEAFLKTQPGVTVQSFSGPMEAFMAVKSKKVDAFVVVEDVAKSYLKKQGGLFMSVLDQGDDTAFGISMKHPETLGSINTVLEGMEKDNFLPELRKKWGIL